jgi:hypothetical protein
MTGIVTGGGAGFLISAVCSFLVSMFAVGVTIFTGLLSLVLGWCFGGLAGAVSGLLLSIIFPLLPSRVLGTVIGAAVGASTPYCLGGGTSVEFVVVCVISGAITGHLIIEALEHTNAEIQKESRSR